MEEDKNHAAHGIHEKRRELAHRSHRWTQIRRKRIRMAKAKAKSSRPFFAPLRGGSQ
jgi:hypothetical protein